MLLEQKDTQQEKQSFVSNKVNDGSKDHPICIEDGLINDIDDSETWLQIGRISLMQKQRETFCLVHLAG